jgi:hypothetical protein
MASLVAKLPGGQQESAPVWVIQENRLTYEPSGEGSPARKKVEETGEGLAEILEEIGKREGVAAVIEYLRHLNIRFNDGGGGLFVGRKFRLRPRDPFHADVAPDWLLHQKGEAENLASAILDFVERHVKGRLVKHARRGNVNGMENFLDVFTAIVRLLYVYHQRGVVRGPALVGRVIQCIEIATGGVEAPELACQGYLLAVADHLRDEETLQQASEEVNFTGHVRAALLIAQKVRFVPNDQSNPYRRPPTGPRECLPTTADLVRDTLAEVGMAEQSWQDVLEALEQYRMFSDGDLLAFRKEWAGR